MLSPLHVRTPHVDDNDEKPNVNPRCALWLAPNICAGWSEGGPPSKCCRHGGAWKESGKYANCQFKVWKVIMMRAIGQILKSYSQFITF